MMNQIGINARRLRHSRPSWRVVTCVFVCLFVSVCVSASAQEVESRTYKVTLGPLTVRSTIESFESANTRRRVPTVIYYQSSSDESQPGSSNRYPLVLLSTTVGSAEQTYSELARYWASHGYIVAVVLHPDVSEGAVEEPPSGSGKKAPPGPSGTAALTRKAQEPEHWRQRVRDIEAILNGLNESKILSEGVDTSRIAIVGHTIGAHTALCMIGQRIDIGEEQNIVLSDTRIDAAIAIGPPPVGLYGTDSKAYQDVIKPCLHVYGGMDIARKLKADGHSSPYDHTKAGDQFLMTIEGADARSFTRQAPAMNTIRRTESNNHEDWIRMTTLAFLDCYLKGDADARAWLSSGDIEQLGLGRVTFESK